MHFSNLLEQTLPRALLSHYILLHLVSAASRQAAAGSQGFINLSGTTGIDAARGPT
jgi:hypothetical protein